MDTRQADAQAHTDILAVKRIQSSDVVFLVPEILHVAGTFYDRYDDDVDLSELEHDFFVYNDDNNCIYKCVNRQDYIDGSAPVPSTVKPSDMGAEKFQTADGYWWKMIYYIPTADREKFIDVNNTTRYLPIRFIPSTTNFDCRGVVESITITNPGSGYRTAPYVVITGDGKGAYGSATINNYGEVTGITVESGGAGYSFAKVTLIGGLGSDATATATISLLGVEPLHSLNIAIAANAQAMAGAIEFIDIENILTTGRGSGYTLESEFTVVGDGTGATVDVVINDDGGVDTIVASNTGLGYTFASIEVTNGPGTGAQFRPIINPIWGHGGNVPTELLSTTVGIVVDVESTQSDFFWTNNFRQIGIVKNIKSYGVYGEIFTENTGDASYHFQVTDIDAYNIDDIITTDGGGRFIVVELNPNGTTNVVKLLPLIDIITENSALVNETADPDGSQDPIIAGTFVAPEINKKTGDIIYLKNVGPYVRQNNQTESLKLYLQF